MSDSRIDYCVLFLSVSFSHSFLFFSLLFPFFLSFIVHLYLFLDFSLNFELREVNFNKKTKNVFHLFIAQLNTKYLLLKFRLRGGTNEQWQVLSAGFQSIFKWICRSIWDLTYSNVFSISLYISISTYIYRVMSKRNKIATYHSLT